MLTLFSRHGLFDLNLDAKGDLEVDFHHTVEDTGITLGEAMREALGDKRGIRRYGCCYLPMVESNLVEGNQKLVPDLSKLTHGQSVTDACIGWEDTVAVLDRFAAAVRARRAL